MDPIKPWPGWLEVSTEAGPVRVRCGRDADGRAEIVGVESVRGPLTSDLLRAIPLARIRAHLTAHEVQLQQPVGVLLALTQPVEDLALDVPPRRHRTDDFYGQVAKLFAGLVGAGQPSPAAAIAEANHVPTTTVHGWVREARKRGLLEAARKGSAT